VAAVDHLLTTGRLVGTAGLRPLEDLGLEIFYSLSPASWGQGYATEAARAVLDYALGPLGLPEVLAEVDEGNAASIAVIERLGMTRFDVVPGRSARWPATAGRQGPHRSGRPHPSAGSAEGRGAQMRRRRVTTPWPISLPSQRLKRLPMSR
jgi:Acetyltransferase (GNAT) domain